MRLPVPTIREVHGAFYVAAICAFAMTATIIWGIVHKVSQSDSILHVAVASADQVQRLNEQLDAQGEQLDALKKQAAANARIAAKNAKAARIAVRQNRQLIAYLRANGIAVPKTLSPRTSDEGGGGSSGPKAQTPSGSSPGPASPDTPGPTATPRPSASPTPNLACDLLPALCVLTGR